MSDCKINFEVDEVQEINFQVEKPEDVSFETELITEIYVIYYNVNFDETVTTYSFYSKTKGYITSIDTSNVDSYTIDGATVNLPFKVEADTTYEIEIVKNEPGTAELLITVESDANEQGLAIQVEQLTTNENYTWYDVKVSATGGTAPYTGTGVFEKETGTYTFTVTDAVGDSVSEDFTVSAYIPDPYFIQKAQYGSFDAANNPVYDEIRLSPFGLYLYAGQTYYINFGDGNDELYTQTVNGFYNNHNYTSEGFYNIEVKAIENNIEIPAETAYYARSGGYLDLRYYNNVLVPDDAQHAFATGIYGDIACLSKDKPSPGDTRQRLYFLCYVNYMNYIYGDIANLKYYDIATFRFAANDISGDIAELINQDFTEIAFNFQIGQQYTCSAIDSSYTEDKSVKSIRLYSPVFDQDEINNLVLQTAQNQIYSGGSLTIAGTQGSDLDLTDPDVLAAYNSLLGLGWSLTINTNP